MNIFAYADESGVFDHVHNDYFVFGGLLFISKEQKDVAGRRYISAERDLRKAGAAAGHQEMKAIYLSNGHKASLFRAMNPYVRFGVVVRQAYVLEAIFDNKKSKQRYLDYVFKIGMKRTMQHMMADGLFQAEDVDSIYVSMDEHSTATDGLYEMRQGLEAEFKYGTFNSTYQKHFPPLFPQMKNVEFVLRDSCQDPLIRAADITANRLYYSVVHKRPEMAKHIFIVNQP
ncbi:MAG: DUF3800 domain-containing protein [Bifidobacterium sp.]|uniref:DUF3800 domain-containing protein n=1 Tax=Bifidobacterium fermentum TaxID=3059035 RepID=A0AB39UD72_9BIFI